MRILARVLCLLAALTVVEGHLLVGQSIAWLTMIHDRTPELGLQEAVADTFSGGNPCQICLAIQDEREEQREETPIPEANPLAKAAPLLFAHKGSRLFTPAAASLDRPRSEHGHDLWQTDVPSPPPWLS